MKPSCIALNGLSTLIVKWYALDAITSARSPSVSVIALLITQLLLDVKVDKIHSDYKFIFAVYLEEPSLKNKKNVMK